MQTHAWTRRILWGFIGTSLLVLGAGILGATALSGTGWFRRFVATCMTLATRGLATVGEMWNSHPVSAAVLILLAGSLAWALARGTMSVVASHRLRKRLTPYVPGTWSDLDDILDATRLPRGCALALAAGADSPAFTLGLWRPWICLSPRLLRDLNLEELRATILHEAVHVERRDPLRLLCVRFACDLLWFLPASRWIGRLFEEGVERAADDRAVAMSACRLELAAAIVKTAQRMGRVATLASALTGTAAVAARVERLLDSRQQAPVRPPAGPLVASAVALVFILSAALTPVISDRGRTALGMSEGAGVYAGLWCGLPNRR